MPQNSRQGHDVRAGLHPVGGEGMPQGMHASARKLYLVQQAMKYTVQVVPVGGIAQAVGENVGLPAPSQALPARRRSRSWAMRRSSRIARSVGVRGMTRLPASVLGRTSSEV